MFIDTVIDDKSHCRRSCPLPSLLSVISISHCSCSSFLLMIQYQYVVNVTIHKPCRITFLHQDRSKVKGGWAINSKLSSLKYLEKDSVDQYLIFYAHSYRKKYTLKYLSGGEDLNFWYRKF